MPVRKKPSNKSGQQRISKKPASRSGKSGKSGWAVYNNKRDSALRAVQQLKLKAAVAEVVSELLKNTGLGQQEVLNQSTSASGSVPRSLTRTLTETSVPSTQARKANVQ